jgi:hypothetical protein
MKTTLEIKLTVESNVEDCYDLRDSVAAVLLGLKQTTLSETDDREIQFQILEVTMPEAGHYEFTPS